MKEGILIIELVSLIIINGKINDTNIHNNNSVRNHIISGDSRVQIEQREREVAERAERDRIENDRILKQTISRAQVTRASRGSVTQTVTGYNRSSGGNSNPYVYGYCTWYVAKEKGITENYGNARNWPVNSSVPAEGAIIVTYESRVGHVGIIRKVEGTKITIQEMNYVGFNKVSTRTVDYRTLPIKGFLI